jgi:hypothetical protein
MALADVAEAAADLILARRAWAVAARNNNRDGGGEEGGPPVPDYATAGEGGDNDDASSMDDDVIGGCLRVLNEQTTLLWEASAAEKHERSTKLTHRRVAGKLLFQLL